MNGSIKVAGIFRAGQFSPNHVGSDAGILELVAAMLRRRGIQVNLYSEDQFIALGIANEQIVMTMCRDKRSLSRLHQLELEGRQVINSSFGITQCIPENMARCLANIDVARPDCLIVETNENVRTLLQKLDMSQCWIKRGDSPMMHKEDLTYVRHGEEAAEILREYFIRDIFTAVVTRHTPGAKLKFYGVEGTDFFDYLFPMNEQTPLDTQALRETCSKAAQALGLIVYGGDAIVDPVTGQFKLLTVNDWPSFSPCRDAAAKAITKLITSRVRKL